MDPITAAIVAAISAGAVGGLTEMSKTILTETYSRLKDLLIKKLGKESEVVQAVEQVEAKPGSQARQALLAEEMAAAQADQDSELQEVARALQQALDSKPGHTAHTQTATGKYIAQANQGSTASVNIGTPSSTPCPKLR